MESGCKTVVGQRLKLAGMRWRADGTDEMCHLRALLKSEPSQWEAFCAGNTTSRRREISHWSPAVNKRSTNKQDAYTNVPVRQFSDQRATACIVTRALGAAQAVGGSRCAGHAAPNACTSWHAGIRAMATGESGRCCGVRLAHQPQARLPAVAARRTARAAQARKKRRGAAGANSCVRRPAEHKDHAWAWDFLHDRASDGRPLKWFTLVDEFTRECLALEVRRRITARAVTDVLVDVIRERGGPVHIRSDNGPEFIAVAIRGWLARRGLDTLYIDPAAPWENGYAESFNSKLRDEPLNGEEFASVRAAHVAAQAWREEYNEVRPHTRTGRSHGPRCNGGRWPVECTP